MIGELCVLVVLLISGALYCRLFGRVQWWLEPFLSLTAGVALLICCSSVQLVLGMTSPRITISIVLLLPLASTVLMYFRRQGSTDLFGMKAACISISGYVITVVLFAITVFACRTFHLVRLSPDSFFYLNVSAVMAAGHTASLEPSLLQLRAMGVPSLHGLASLNDEMYVRSITPLLFVCLNWLTATFCFLAIRPLATRRMAVVIALTAIAVVCTHHRMLWHARFINGHILTALMLLIISGGSWLQSVGRIENSALLNGVQLVALPAMVLTRPDGAIFAGLAILPVLAADSIPLNHRKRLLVSMGLSTIAWHLLLAIRFAASGSGVPITVSGMLAAGILCCVTAKLLTEKKLGGIHSHAVLWIAEVGLIFVVLYFAVTELADFRFSLRATFHNVVLGAGQWGISLKLTIAIVAASIAGWENRDRGILRYPLTTLLPAAFLLAHLRHVPYRMGAGDTLNRYFVHFVPLAVLFIVTTAGMNKRGIVENCGSRGAS